MEIEDDMYNNKLTKEESKLTKEETKLELVDYAILKSLIFGPKTITDMVGLLEIRSLVIEKHIYELIKVGFVNFQQRFFITQNGKEKIYSFERDNPVDFWKSVDDFIVLSIENKKNRKIRLYKTVDFLLLISMAILIILIIYVWIYY